jgi:hypothetical protein
VRAALCVNMLAPDTACFIHALQWQSARHSQTHAGHSRHAVDSDPHHRITGLSVLCCVAASHASAAVCAQPYVTCQQDAC